MLHLRKKSSGKLRKIHNPSKLMRLVQYRILTRVLEQIALPDYIHGFEKGKSIPLMARTHVGQTAVVSLDIQDFFPSVKQHMVETALRAVGIGELPARTLSELTTFKSYVPQGALTSPKISNLITAGTFGPPIKAFCEERGFALTIYADDITVSFSENDRERSKVLVREIKDFVSGVLRSYRFTVNREKTKTMFRNSRQWVCGAVVNDRVNMQRRERLQLRALVHNTRTNGVEVEAAKAGLETAAFIRRYAGRLNWLHQLNPTAGDKLRPVFKQAASTYLAMVNLGEIPELAWDSSAPTFTSPEDENAERQMLPENQSNEPAPF